MVCKICHEMLYYGQKGRKASGSNLQQLSFSHHANFKKLQDSANTGCYLCRVINEQLQSLALTTNRDNNVEQKLSATLRPFRRVQPEGLYQLDFRLEDKSTHIASFVLKKTGNQNVAKVKLKPVSRTTSDPKVLQIARDWISECVDSHEKCGVTPDPTWTCPSRLLDLQPMIDAGRATETVRLVSRKEKEVRPNQPLMEGPYATLSHRWGREPFFKLTDDTLPGFLTGVSLRELPRTFQDAIKVACELKIRWLWIDALCIIQEQEDLKDWLEESETMEKVYTQSYCNISATAALDSSKGLFTAGRDMNWSWVENVTLNTAGLRGGAQEKVECTILDLSFWEKYVDNAPVNRRSWVYQERLLAPRVIHWCQDQIAFECREVSRAECRPEGLPHFRMKSGTLIDGVRLKSVDLDAGKQLRALREASSQGRATTSKVLQRMVDDINPKYHLYELWKHWVEVYSKLEITKDRDRLIALSGIARMMTSKIKAEDVEEEYIAGMWRKHLASQLLWFVNEGAGRNRQPFVITRPEEYRAPSFSWASVETPRGITFPETKDLPKIDSEDPDSKPKERFLVEVEIVRLTYRTDKDKFGMITDGYLVLRGVLRKIELTDSMAPKQRPTPSKREAVIRAISWDRYLLVALTLCMMPSVVMLQFCGTTCIRQSWLSLSIWTGCFAILSLFCFTLRTIQYRLAHDPEEEPSVEENRYSWRLVQDGHPVGKNYQIVYLDSPASEPTIFGPAAQVYCLPMMKEERYLTCLLVQVTGGEYGIRYKRVGLTKVSSLTQELLHNLTTPPGHNKTDLGEYYWGVNSRLRGESTICII